MDYDQLEEQYYIVLQKNKELERQVNSLSLRNIELEATNVILENSLQTSSNTAESLANQVQEQTLKAVNLRVLLDEANKKLDDEKGIKLSALQSAVFNDSEVLQKARNYKDMRQPAGLIEGSVHRPMIDQGVIEVHNQHMILNVTDVFGMYKSMGPYGPEFHTYGKSGDKVVRYATKDMFGLERREDFAVVLNQMTDALKQLYINEYSKSNFR